MPKEQFECPGCGAQATFDPDSGKLKCQYCGLEKNIPRSEKEIKELDFNVYLEKVAYEKETLEILTLKCPNCSAESTAEPNVTSSNCPFCGTSIVSTAKSKKIIKPQSLLPFKVTRKEAESAFKKWLNGLWFAPSRLKKDARKTKALKGVYLPYWTFDSNTTSYYRGERGENYYVTETYYANENGRQVQKTRRVRKIRWHPVDGWVWNKFNDVLVCASKSLPRKYVDRLEPWDLQELTIYEDQYLGGFVTENYQIPLEESFNMAKVFMEKRNMEKACLQIGGDHQRVHYINTQYDDVTFKHVLLPIWISAYKFKNKVYRFLVNGRTCEVQSERPWSWIKIALAILAGMGIISILLMLASK